MRVNWPVLAAFLAVPAIGAAVWVSIVCGAVYLIESPTVYNVVTTVILHR